MKYEDLSFTTVNEMGKEVINDVIGVVPNLKNAEQPYVIFSDYQLDDNGEFVKHYGKLIKFNDNFGIETKLVQGEIEYIEKSMQDDIVKYVNDTIEENLHE